MIRMTVRLKSVSCADTEDVTGADHFYTVSALTTGDVNETQAAISTPRKINDDESKPLDHIVFDGIIDDGATVRGGIVAFDEDAAKDWEKKPEWVETVRDKVVSGLKDSEVPLLTAAGAVLDWAYKGIEFLMKLDQDDKLGSETFEFTAGGPARQTLKWNFSKGDWSGYSDWQYSVEVEVLRKAVPRISSVWRPGQAAEIQLYGVPFEAFKDRYDELWPQEWRLHLLQVYNDPAGIRYDAVWRPGTTGERQIYGASFAEFKKAYDELWPQGWRLELLQVVPRENGNRYYAVWRPGQAAELHLWGAPFETFKQRYDELWPQSWRLHVLQVYSDAAGIRYDAIWRPGTAGEWQVYGVSYADFKKTYDDLWPKGWRRRCSRSSPILRGLATTRSGSLDRPARCSSTALPTRRSNSGTTSSGPRDGGCTSSSGADPAEFGVGKGPAPALERRRGSGSPGTCLRTRGHCPLVPET